MIISREDIELLAAYLDLRGALPSIFRGGELLADSPELGDWGEIDHHLGNLVREHPQFLLPCGFDEVRYVQMGDVGCFGKYPLSDDERIWMSEDWLCDESDNFPYQVLFRATTGKWHALEDDHFGDIVAPPPYAVQLLDYIGKEKTETGYTESATTITITGREILTSCEKALSADSLPAAILLPNLWFPPWRYPKIELIETTHHILNALQKEVTTLEELTWQQLEDVVAELLRLRGMNVEVTRRSADGGRDIVARGELIPGEPAILAVEVKHKRVVKIGDLRGAIYANKDFPALMFATSGRFSAGVVREKKKPETFLRLLLKDGAALGQWIQSYRSIF